MEGANKIINENLNPLGLPVLSEENKQIPYEERKHWNEFWLVDPLDGTKEFVKRNGEFTINIALVEGTVPVLGVVYAPLPDLLYFAWQGGGPDSTGRPGPPGGSYRLAGFSQLAARIPEDLVERSDRMPHRQPFDFDETQKKASITVIGSRSHGGPHFAGYVRKLRRRYADRVEVKTSGSALKPCLVADGAADIYPRFGPTMEWDTAAPHAVVRGVGKRMVAFESGLELVYNKEQLVNPSFIVF